MLTTTPKVCFSSDDSENEKAQATQATAGGRHGAAHKEGSGD